MNGKNGWLRLLLALLILPGAASAASQTYETQTLEGWTVKVDTRLRTTHKAETEVALGLLAEQLKDIVRVVPAGPVVQLRKVTLWLTPAYVGLPMAAQYHMGPDWPREHGHDPAVARGVEISNIPIYAAESKRMPLFVLHELAHAYHDQVLGIRNAEVKAAFTRAVERKSYERVERFNGPGLPVTFERAYGMNNELEFFAETTEAFFGRNDFYPFTRDELARHDPATGALLQKLWQVPVAAGFDVRCYYRLTTAWQGEGVSLDILNDGKANNTPILAKTAVVSGQLWKLLPEAGGVYRLVTQWRGSGLSLANTAGNRPLLVTTASVPEQLWKVTPEANGTFRLTSQTPGAALSLDILNDGKANNTPILAQTAVVSGQMWKATPVGACP